MKTCTKCKLTKTLDRFPFNSITKDGRSSWCRTCKMNSQKLKPKRRAIPDSYSAYKKKQKTVLRTSTEFVLCARGKRFVSFKSVDGRARFAISIPSRFPHVFTKFGVWFKITKDFCCKQCSTPTNKD